MPQNNRGLPSSYTHCYLISNFSFQPGFDGRNRETCTPVIIVSYILFKYAFAYILSGETSVKTMHFKMKISTKSHANLFDSLVKTNK